MFLTRLASRLPLCPLRHRMNGCFVASSPPWRCLPGPQPPPFPPRRATSATKSARTAPCSTGTRWWATSRRSQKSSDRIQVEELGKTAEGRPFIAATIADPETLKHLDRYIAIQQQAGRPAQDPAGRSRAAVPRRQGRGADHLLHPRHRDRLHPHRGGVRLPPAHRGHPALQRHPEEHHPAAGALAESRWRGHRDALVPQDAGHAVRRHLAAGVVPPLRGPRQQSRLVHLLAAGNALTISQAAQRVASARSSTTCTSWARTRRASSCRRGSTRSIRTSTRS